MNSTAVQRWPVGTLTVTRIVEIAAHLPLAQFLPTGARPFNEADLAWLVPDYLDDNGDVRTSIQSFLIESGPVRILVDTCVGNGKQRSHEALSMLSTGYVDRLRAAGCETSDVDIVVCTHLHFDHVGWNTRPSATGDGWVPTFERARYVFSASEWHFWQANPDAQPQFDSADVLADSVWPLADHGVVELRDPGFELAPGVRIGAGHGHTPGHLVVELSSEGEHAVITGDLIHSPIQLVDPGWHGRADIDLPASIAARRRLLEHAAATGRVVFGTHFPDPCAGRVVEAGAGFRFEALDPS